MILGSELELKKVKTAVSKYSGILQKLGEEAVGQISLFTNNHCLLDLLDLPVVWWFCEVSVYLSAWPSGCEQLHMKYMYVYIFFIRRD